MARRRSRVIAALHVFWKPALNAHLGSAALDRFHRLRHERVRRMKIGVRRVRPAAESAKRAADDAHVGEVQVPVHDVGNAIADRAAAKLVRHLHQREEIVPFDRGQGEPLFEVESASVERLLEQAGNRETGGPQRLLPGDFSPARLHRFNGRLRHGSHFRTSVPVFTPEILQVRLYASVHELRLRSEFRIDRQPFAQDEAGSGRSRWPARESAARPLRD